MESNDCNNKMVNSKPKDCCDTQQMPETEKESPEPIAGTNIDDTIDMSNASHTDLDLEGLEVFEQSYVKNKMENYTENNCLPTEEPKMCNEKTATYWTGGRDDLQDEDVPAPKHLNDRKLDIDWTIPYYLTENNSLHKNVRTYFPLHKTLRNLRLLDMRLKYSTRQLALENKSSEYTNDSGSGTDEGDVKFSEQKQRANVMQEESEQMHISSLIELLSQCRLKLEQMEDLEKYSRDMEINLQETITYLKQNIAALQRENAQQEDEIFFLAEELIQCKRMLHEKTEKISHMNTMFKNFGQRLENTRKYQQIDSICQINNSSGQSSENPEPRDLKSKVCVIL
ncbi:uncharacterized protein LOC128635900 [Bombina bombina]|uniref:uncharacterized protein LOC128635900 n=1 Tax=Bombina bombina TaxID=8345 RepID=UPI00235B0A5E|nr:uncharacterized protein LOC128635900 [Bombina bombina]